MFDKINYKKKKKRLHASTEGSVGSIPDWELRSHVTSRAAKIKRPPAAIFLMKMTWTVFVCLFIYFVFILSHLNIDVITITND